MDNRREFLKKASLIGSAILIHPRFLERAKASVSEACFGVHPFVDLNPDAVFIMRTNVDTKTNSAEKYTAANAFGSSILVPRAKEDGGIPITRKIAIKPNLTEYSTRGKYTREGAMGIITDVDFVEGIIDSLIDLNISETQIFLRETNMNEALYVENGYRDMADRTGVDLPDLTAGLNGLDESQIQWVDVPNGSWFKRIPYLSPVNAPDTFLLNIAKLKAHGMGLTLCAKNLQGTISRSYQAHCTAYSSNMSIPEADIVDNAKTIIKNNYDRHVADGVPRWDRPGTNHTSGLGMETWATRCLDNNSITKPDLHIIEGIYGRDGNFLDGPHDGYAQDFMSNVIIFGKNPFYVDIIGHWLGGHEPGNFGLFHLAMERNFISFIDPTKIPLYEWKGDGSATLAALDDFSRTPLLTYYLTRDYDGQTEDYWHLCDESYDYKTTGIINNLSAKPKSFILNQNYPNPFNPSTTIGFYTPKKGFVRLEIFNGRGEIVDLLVNENLQPGNHMRAWNSKKLPSGTYFYTLHFDSFSETKRMLLIK